MLTLAVAGGNVPVGSSLHMVWNIAFCSVVSEFTGSAAGLVNGFLGDANMGGSAKGGLLDARSKKSNMLCAFASRYVKAGRFHFVSTNFRIDVWSNV